MTSGASTLAWLRYGNDVWRQTIQHMQLRTSHMVRWMQGLEILPNFKNAILAGDHLQLPPVVKSDDAKRLGFDKSFMEWMVEKLTDRHFLLDTQYRSHKMISGWSSKVLYDGKLKAGKNNRAKRLIDSYKNGEKICLIFFTPLPPRCRDLEF